MTVRSIEPSSHESFPISPYVKNENDIGNETLDLKDLKDKYPHLEPVPGEKIHYSDVKLILGQDAYEAIRPIEYFTVRRTKDTPLAVRLALQAGSSVDQFHLLSRARLHVSPPLPNRTMNLHKLSSLRMTLSHTEHTRQWTANRKPMPVLWIS